MSIAESLTTLFPFLNRPAKFRVVDHDELAAELEPDKLGAADGVNNEPPSGATEPGSREHGFRRHFLARQAGVNKEFGDQLAGEQVKREQARAQFSAGRFEEIHQDTRHLLDTLRANTRAALTVARYAEQHALRILKHFKTTRGIVRDAEYPESYARLYAGLAIAILVDAIANCFLFAMGSNLGLLGGLQEALIVAAINVLLSYHVGSALRGLHNPGWRRAAAALLGAGFIAGLVIFNLAVGHYRAALAGPSPETAVTTAITTLKSDPLAALEDVHTWLLILVGALTALGAAVVSYMSDDVIFGYGRVDRRHKAAVALYAQGKDEYRDGIQDGGDTALAAVDRQLEAAQEGLDTFRTSANETRALVTHYEMLSQGVHNAYVTTVQRYRAANTRVRTQPPPAYFQLSPAPFEDDAFLDVTVLEIGAPDQVAAELRDAWHRAEAAAEQCKRQIRALVAARLEEIPELVREIEADVAQPDGPAPQPVPAYSGNGSSGGVVLGPATAPTEGNGGAAGVPGQPFAGETPVPEEHDAGDNDVGQ